MLNRKIYGEIERFYSEHKKMALMVTGARQVGKSFIIEEYAKTAFESYIRIDFIENPEYADLFKSSGNAEETLLRISAEFGDRLIPGNTLIFFDEVQECPEIITQIKYLVLDDRYSFILSGSLLGTVFRDIRSVPVGYLSVIQMYPLDFEEFAIANGVGQGVLDKLRECFFNTTPVDEYIHKRMLELFELYLIVGGMPAAVSAYLESSNLQTVARNQTSILDLYRADISKYEQNSKLYLKEIFDLIPSEINAKNKRFILKNLNEYTKFSKYNNSFLWLKNAGVALPVYAANEPVVPLILSKSTNLFKLFMNDVGLLAAVYGKGIQISILKHETEINHGAIYENVAAQELSAHGFELFFYNNKKNGELDFVIEKEGRVIPIEIKSGKDYYRHAAMDNVMNISDYDIQTGYVFCNGNVENVGKIHYMPIYMITFLEKEATNEELIYETDFTDLR